MEPTGKFGDFATGEGVRGHGSIVTHGESVRGEGSSAVPCLVADEPKGPSDEDQEDGLSPAERIGRVASDWLHDRPRPYRWGLEPVEVAMFAVIAAVVLSVLAGVLQAIDLYEPLEGNQAAFVIDAVTQWADLPVALGLLGAALLAWYQTERSCIQVENWLRDDEWYEGTLKDEELAAEIDGIVSTGLRRLRRQRFAAVCIGLLGLLTAAASLTLLYWVFTLGANSALNAWGYFALVLSRLPVVVPALACVVIAPSIWARGSDLLRRYDSGVGFKDEPEHPAAPEPIS
jgi:hypothetical protein